MELPPAGWYPDPHGTPDLLRWWDGSGWTQHTHASVTPDGSDGGQSAAAAQQAAPAQAAAWGTDQLVKAGPPTGQPTSPQPALPDTVLGATRVQGAVQPTAYQPAVTAVQPTTVQPATVAPTRVQAPVQPTTVQPTTVQPTTVQPQAGLGGLGGADAGGTQVLFLGGDAWTTPGTPGGPGDRYGYQRVQQERRRRMIMYGGLAGGTVAALAVIAVVVSSMGGSGASPTAQQLPASPTAPAASTSSTVPSPTPSTSAPASFLSDQQAGLSYAQLPAPWQDSCPASLNNGAFSWTAGESAIAGQVNSGQSTWYGEACSGPLPQQYGYGGVPTLESTAVNVANTFTDAYYNGLDHTVTTQVSQPIQVSGHAGWEVKFLVTYTNAAGQGAVFTDEQGAVVVADTGTGLAPAVFFASIPSTLGESNVDSLVSSLQLNVAPTAGGSPGDGSPAPGDGGAGSPPGNGNGNNP